MVTAKTENHGYLDKWYLDLEPSTITFYDTKTSMRIVDLSYMAMEVKKSPAPVDPETGREAPTKTILLGQPLAVGRKALAYQGRPDVAVFSPFRDGQIANWGLSSYFIRTFLSQVRPQSLFKPTLCIHTQPQTTPVEAQAFIDAGLYAGARRVYLYEESFPEILNYISEKKIKKIKDPIVIHIEPQS